MCFHECSDEAVLELSEALQTNTSLDKLTLTYYELSDEAVLALAGSLPVDCHGLPFLRAKTCSLNQNFTSTGI